MGNHFHIKPSQAYPTLEMLDLTPKKTPFYIIYLSDTIMTSKNRTDLKFRIVKLRLKLQTNFDQRNIQ